MILSLQPAVNVNAQDVLQMAQTLAYLRNLSLDDRAQGSLELSLHLHFKILEIKPPKHLCVALEDLQLFT